MPLQRNNSLQGALNEGSFSILTGFEKCKDDTGKKLEDASKEIIEIEEQLPCERCTELENRIKQLQERIAFMEDIHQKEVDNINRRLMSVEEERRQLEAESYDIRKERDKLRDELNTFRGNSSALGHTPPVVRSLQSVLSGINFVLFRVHIFMFFYAIARTEVNILKEPTLF